MTTFAPPLTDAETLALIETARDAADCYIEAILAEHHLAAQLDFAGFRERAMLHDMIIRISGRAAEASRGLGTAIQDLEKAGYPIEASEIIEDARARLRDARIEAAERVLERERGTAGTVA